ncbi:N-acetylmuramoyl-L-alanine amidase [Streptomyces sp. JB150]|uniref:N-acetylmuramoyl-L-alanine amidase n=1 Tax=Streptomyces sp. JB150 TaxID=2714844 RepID=UPI001407E150|nr:N-acetylmuramoyl-L-alanine amidase [Streptomyces sp. JB150]QIJ62309.1 N-acetylmuramoyl-L-alanine amidase [Streptomyces sp. JB150]
MSYAGPEFEPPPARRPRRRLIAVVGGAVVVGALAGWLAVQGAGGPGGGGSRASGTAAPAGTASSASTPSGTASSSPSGDDRPGPAPTGAAPSGPLKGKVVVIDPGHNPENFRHTADINKKVDIGTGRKECDTTGTSTDDGYTEAEFTLDVAHRLRDLLEGQGATVKLTQDADRPFGPCIDERARIGNEADADAVVSVHADGSGAGNRGFHVILPGEVRAGAADTRAIVGPSRELGERIAGNFVRATGSAPSNYVGDGTGLVTREDLGGLNLSTVPKVFIECGNMRDSKDAALLTSGAWRQAAARGISDGIVSFLRG